MLEPRYMDSLGHQHCTKKLSPKITLHFKVLCESKATLPIYEKEGGGFFRYRGIWMGNITPPLYFLINPFFEGIPLIFSHILSLTLLLPFYTLLSRLKKASTTFILEQNRD